MRCAIYTRKSADERADHRFSTIENQRDLCGKYIASQAGDGWRELTTRYDDLGYSGGTLKRPALDRLRRDIAARLVDVVVVYKIDRLSRSLRDFVNLVGEFEGSQVSFVSVTQSFDTRSSMGRLTLNVLLSFAQFERELTSERLKDWFAGARARGHWNGPAPYGYSVEKAKLIINEEQARYVRHMFQRYPILGSAKEVADEISRSGALNTWGRAINGWQVMRILRNRLYIGELPHRGQFLPGIHDPIITLREWDRTAKAIKKMAGRRRAKHKIPREAPLYGLLHDRLGRPMIQLCGKSHGRLYRYYVPSRKRYGPTTSPGERFRAGELDQAVIDATEAVGFVRPQDDRPGALTGHLRRIISRIDIDGLGMTITLVTGATIVADVAGQISPTKRTSKRPDGGI